MAIQFWKEGKQPKPLESQLDKTKEVKVLEQTGKKPNIARDLGRSAKLPGKKISKYGKLYWETRKNRTDAPGSRL
jgi:hypothetical protein